MIKAEEGYSLIENLVALAIFVSVLLPAASYLGYYANQVNNKNRIYAAALAQYHMEELLHNQELEVGSLKVVQEKWVIERDIQQAEGLFKITVTVKRNSPSAVSVALKTLRPVK